MNLVLASTSPRRKELLEQLLQLEPQQGFECVAPDIDESQYENEAADVFVKRLALEKAQEGLRQVAGTDAVVLGADTIVVLGDIILGKPNNIEHAIEILSRLSGQTHKVMTAVALVSEHKTLVECIETQVNFSNLTHQDIVAYVNTKEPMDKAGAYGIQGIGGTFVESIQGDYFAVVGLPLATTKKLLTAFK
ncbi:septum formation inhibitor Maf [Shewanella sp. 202IG2-18]|uniref:Maf family protein n=1 Tax=Parashewanella hymeniacidonis TaxID=2807618 RepID=UPI0019604E90|nr:Maf family protein [Parashewanella hymeniacidonis]MBM7072367.1 septum formation inhibitor Maf [Parashewanella hymeniacidonis]